MQEGHQTVNRAITRQTRWLIFQTNLIGEMGNFTTTFPLKGEFNKSKMTMSMRAPTASEKHLERDSMDPNEEEDRNSSTHSLFFFLVTLLHIL